MPLVLVPPPLPTVMPGKAVRPREQRCSRRPWIRFALLALWAATLLHAQPNPSGEGYLGAKACAACHPQNYETQSRSGHAQALFPAAQHPLVHEVFARPEWSRSPDARFVFSDPPGGPRVHAYYGERQIEMPIEWAFGSGDKGITFVSHLEQERYIEYSFTWYGATHAMALTAGHPGEQPQSLTQALGVVYDAFSVPATILACFQCHSTGPVDLSDDFAIRPAELGVRCEVCHGPGQQHVAAVRQGDTEKARSLILNPARLPAAKINELCGNCHRVPAASGQAFDFSDPWHVRHQPPYLSRSRCFRESQGALTCFTCHDPHQKLQRNAPEHYNARCTTCHKDLEAHPALTADATTPLSDCITCHMPKVSPQPYLSFTNHWIGIYRGQVLQPLR
jgi:Cytochrome c554 and c-prime